MKKFLIYAFTVILLLTSNLTVWATSNTYKLDELGLQVAIPTEYSVITRDTPADDPIFDKLGTTQSAIIDQFKLQSIYLNAVSDIYGDEIVVTMTENSLNDFSSMGETALNTLASVLVKQFPKFGFYISKHDIYQHAQAKFIRMYFTNKDSSVHGLQYYTIYDGKAMNFTIRSYAGSVSSRQEAAIKSVVDSIQYEETLLVTEQEDTDSFIYTDKDSDVMFTVPANWQQKALSKEREFIDVKFVSTTDGGCTIIYGSTDLWEKMPASERVGYIRTDLNNTAFTKEDVAEMYNVSADKIAMATYNGVQYFKCVTDYTSEALGTDITITMTQLVYIDNGWAYTFQFGGTSNHKLYSDFESLLKSVQYPTVTDTAGGTGNNTGTKNNNESTDGADVIAFLALLSIVAVIVVVAVVSRKKKAKQEISPDSFCDIETVITCKNCGQALSKDSAFCHMCGAKMGEEK